MSPALRRACPRSARAHGGNARLVVVIAVLSLSAACAGGGSAFAGKQWSTSSQTTFPLPFLNKERPCAARLEIARLALKDVGRVDSEAGADHVEGGVRGFRVRAACRGAGMTYETIGKDEATAPPPSDVSCGAPSISIGRGSTRSRTPAQVAIDTWQRAEKRHEDAYDARHKKTSSNPDL